MAIIFLSGATSILKARQPSTLYKDVRRSLYAVRLQQKPEIIHGQNSLRKPA